MFDYPHIILHADRGVFHFLDSESSACPSLPFRQSLSIQTNPLNADSDSNPGRAKPSTIRKFACHRGSRTPLYCFGTHSHREFEKFSSVSGELQHKDLMNNT
ncbi:hypothetical protein CPB83DRAFT_201995 [Crepidotus variabilis]|uniref:Uncharacterized protein n=1 Tax=Crepidotus variabilis TaxID=179855 RepID=A0A9P6E328_9AGAR|nr:hypothetical protein CPB83DRAFT_201995 [Crepidotus variabilis]